MKIWSFKSLLFVASLGLFITSCTDDGGGSTVDQGPTVSLESGSGLFSTDTSIIFGQEFTVSVKGAKTSNDLKTITVEEAGVKLAEEWGVSYFDVSAKTCTNVHEAFVDLVRKVMYSKFKTQKPKKKSKNCSIL